MLGDSSSAVLGGGGAGGNSSDAVAPTVMAVAAARTPSHDGDDSTAAVAEAGSNPGEEDLRGRGEEGDRSFGGNRWPRQETLALLKMRSDMDVLFRDASVKAPLWEDVSRKMAELGYHRSAKKCKEKFENLYKYHKRTKDGRTGKSDGKTYRFFEQLEALEHQNHPPPPPTHAFQSSQQPPQAPPSNPPSSSQLLAIPATPVSVVVTTTPLSSSTNVLNHPHLSTVPSTFTPINLTSSTINHPPASYNIFPPPPPLPSTSTANPIQSSFPTDLLSNSPSSSTSSDESIERRQRRKRKWKDFFGRLTKEVMEKQEQMQKRLLEAIEKREHERMVREDAWRIQEMARINREREILAQERSMAAAKDAAVMALLQKIADQQNLSLPLNNINISPPPQPPPPMAQPTAKPAPAPPPAQPQQTSVTNMVIVASDNNNDNHNRENLMTPSSSRWPKVEVEALIRLRTSMDEKYQENGPKGPLWEEISAAMRRLGYNRNAKRCKEKWENINKYFKKVKESNKKRPEDSKTCPYFHQLDALYREKNNRLEMINTLPPPPSSATTANHNMNPADNNTTIPLMVQPEQQWPPQQDTSRENSNNNAELDEEEEEDDMDEEKDIEDEDDEEEEEEEEEGGGNYEIVASKPASVSTAE